MTERNLAKVTIFLSDREYREANTQIHHEILGDHSPADGFNIIIQNVK